MLLIYQIGYNNKALNILCNVVYATLGLKLVGVARASLEELLPDYNDFLRQLEKQFLDQGASPKHFIVHGRTRECDSK
jgi:hypothetical protein